MPCGAGRGGRPEAADGRRAAGRKGRCGSGCGKVQMVQASSFRASDGWASEESGGAGADERMRQGANGASRFLSGGRGDGRVRRGTVLADEGVRGGANGASRFLSGGRGDGRVRRGTRPTQRAGGFSPPFHAGGGRRVFFAKQEKTPCCQAKKERSEALFLQSRRHPKLFIAW